MQPQGGGVTGWGWGCVHYSALQVQIFHPGNLDLAFRPFRPGLGDGAGGGWLHGWLGGWVVVWVLRWMAGSVGPATGPHPGPRPR